MNDLEKNPENMTAEITTGGNSPTNLTGTSGGIVMQLIVGCNSKTTNRRSSIIQQKNYIHFNES